MLRLQDSTHSYCLLEVARGAVQLVRRDAEIGLDVQALEHRADCRNVQSHSYLILTRVEAQTLCERLGGMLDAPAEPVGQHVLPFRIAA